MLPTNSQTSNSMPQ